MPLTLQIPPEVAEALRFPPDAVDAELRKELALALYQREALPLGKARQLAGMTRWAFEEILGERRIPRHYTAADLEEDLGHARRQ